jgi:hypothetical protein
MTLSLRYYALIITKEIFDVDFTSCPNVSKLNAINGQEAYEQDIYRQV